MGLSIHFTGQLRDIKLLPDFVTEVEDIARSLDWKNIRIERVMPVPETSEIPEERQEDGILIRGIHITPPECETLCFTFAPSGKLMTLMGLLSAETYPDFDFVYWTHTKTQYAGIEVHIAVIELIRYLDKKYFQSFELLDEGNYWETKDVSELQAQFTQYTQLIAVVKNALEKATIPSHLEENEMLRQLTDIIRKGLEDLEN